MTKKTKTWKKLKPYNGKIHQGCFNCPPVLSKAKMYTRIAVGFGYAGIEKDGKSIFTEKADMDWGDIPTLMKFENMARRDPDHDWRLILDAPLRSREYQRQGHNNWILVKSGQGFA